MINPITTNLNFRSYYQKFTDEEFQQRIEESLIWAKENADNTKYFRSKFMMNKKLENDAKGAFKTLEKFRHEFKKTKFEPSVVLSMRDKTLIGKVLYLNSTPVEVTTEMPCSIKPFLKGLKKAGEFQMQEDKLNLEYWDLKEKLKRTEAEQKARYKILSGKSENPNPILLAFDNYYGILTEKVLSLTKSINEISIDIESIKSKLKNRQYKIKTKI